MLWPPGRSVSRGLELVPDTGDGGAISATVHGFSTGYCWAAGIYAGGAIACGALIRPGTRMDHDPGQPEPLEEPITVIS